MEDKCVNPKKQQKRKNQDEDTTSFKNICQEDNPTPSPTKCVSSFDVEKFQKVVQEIETKLKAKRRAELHRVLKSKTGEYHMHQVLGKGTYGKVVRCLKAGTREQVAVKVYKDTTDAINSSYAECTALYRLSVENPDEFHIVRPLDFFTIKNESFLVTEMLDQNLFDYLEGNSFKPLPLGDIAVIMKQVLTALLKLKDMNIIHADVKPANIMLVDTVKRPLSIKLIDFGLSIQLPAGRLPECTQTIYYRAPEVILGLPYSLPIDMWSAGCVLAELLLGFPLYPCNTEYDLIRYICETQGVPPQHMIKNTAKVQQFFNHENSKESVNQWKLKTPEQYHRETGIQHLECRKHVFRNLDEIIQVSSRLTADRKEEEAVYDLKKVQCMSLLRDMLSTCERTRITPEEALKRDFLKHSQVPKNS